jgi:hypothetical protein
MKVMTAVRSGTCSFLGLESCLVLDAPTWMRWCNVHNIQNHFLMCGIYGDTNLAARMRQRTALGFAIGCHPLCCMCVCVYLQITR